MPNIIKKIISDDKELKLYKRLGVLTFQKMVFRLERLVHYKDHGYNINYHPQGNSIIKLERFKKYLYYNGSIHIKNIIILLISILSNIIFIHSISFLVITLLLMVKDSYCVMLQRYNYIRIEKTINKMKIIEEKKKQKEKESIKSNQELCTLLKGINIDFLSKLENAIINRAGVSFDESDKEDLTTVEEAIDISKIKRKVI